MTVQWAGQTLSDENVVYSLRGRATGSQAGSVYKKSTRDACLPESYGVTVT